MAEDFDPRDDERGQRVRRRGLIAGAAALVVALAAKQAGDTPPVLADNGNFLRLGELFSNFSGVDTNNNFASRTGVVYTGPSISQAGAAFVVSDNTADSGLAHPAILAGITVNSGTGAKSGVYGDYGITNGGGSGVYGASFGGTNGSGVLGVGVNNTTGVQGTSTSGIGILGTSSGNYGILGTSTKPGFAGLTGITSTANVPAFAGGSTVNTALAAQFNGGVFVDCSSAAGGQFVVNPMSAKFGTVTHADGSLRLMASMEAPESWAVDMGRGQLVNGKGQVTFDKDFASVIEPTDYLVVLTAGGETKGLYFTDQTASGFAVREQQGGTGTLGFTWVVYAHPRGQKSERLKKFVAPAPLHLPTADELPKPPVPKQPTLP